MIRRIPDLVADLRASTHLFYNRPQLLAEAADEIERLRAAQPKVT